MRISDRMVLAVTLAVALVSLTLGPLTADLSYVGTSWGFLLVLGAASALLHRARPGVGGVLAGQVGLLALLSLGLALALPGSGYGLPWYTRYVALWQDGIGHMQSQAAPMAPDDGVTLIFATVVAALFVVTDLLATSLSRPTWSVVPLAGLFAVPALTLDLDTGLGSFLLVALGYLGVLLADGLGVAARWTRGLSRDTAGSGGETAVVWRAAALVGVPALVLTLLVAAVLPSLAIPGFSFGSGSGGNGPLQLTDPSLDIRRNLHQPSDREVIDYRTDRPGGLYLRLASLPQFNANGWSSVQIRLNDGGQLPAVPGLVDETAPERSTTITVRDFRSQYLPLPYAPRSYRVRAGDWRYDANSLTVVNGDNSASALSGLTYDVQSVDVAPDSDDLHGAVAGTPADAAVTGVLPKDLPKDLVQLTQSVIEGADGPAEQAAKIQAYLRSSRFTYSTDPLPGSGYQALEDFLLRDHRGYCEQFATAMAMMARVAGIPSRVSVGFLPGKKDGDTWRVSIRDMHAWPELYFSGYGWVRFEPTPSGVTGTAPPWTLQDRDRASGSASSEPSVAPTTQASRPAEVPTDAPSTAPPTSSATPGFPWGRTLLGTGAGLLALVVLAAPATIRVRRRSARLDPHQPGTDQVEAAWAEIRDTVLDHGGSWPQGSPRRIGDEVGRRLEPEESAAMGRVATLVERSRYARSFDDPAATAALPDLTSGIRRGLTAPLTRRQRLLALLVPRSLFRRRRDT